MDAVSESAFPVVRTKPDDDVEKTLETELERAEKTSESFESSLQDSFERQRRMKRELRRAEERTIRLKEELDETLRTIREDRQRIMALQAEQSFTAKQIKDALSLDLKQYEATLRSKQPDLYDYCCQATNARDCVVVINSIRLCRRHIQLAEMLIAHRYASFLSEKPPNAAHANHHALASQPSTGGNGGGGQSPVSVQSSPVCPALTSASSTLSQPSPTVNQPPPVNHSPAVVHQTSAVNQQQQQQQLSCVSHQQSAAALQHHPYHHHHHQHRIKSEKMKPRRLSLVKVDPRTTAAAMTTVAVATSTSASSRTAASVSTAAAAKTGSGSRDAAATAAANVVRVEIRERDSHPPWILATRDIKPIVLTYVGK